MLSAEYSAGFFDGEGSISLVCRKTRPEEDRPGGAWMLCVTVAQMNPAPPYALKETWGGTVRGPRVNRQYEWRLPTKGAEDFLRAIQPHVIVKADVVALALEFRDGILRRGGRLPGGRAHSLAPAELERRHGLRREIQRCNRRWSRSRARRVVTDGLIDLNA